MIASSGGSPLRMLCGSGPTLASKLGLGVFRAIGYQQMGFNTQPPILFVSDRNGSEYSVTKLESTTAAHLSRQH